MERLTYKQAYDKIIEAYFKDEIQPFSGTFCFCGTLCGTSDWIYKSSVKGLYEDNDLFKMGTALYLPLMRVGLIMIGTRMHGSNCNNVEAYDEAMRHPNYEDALFAGMSAALDVLKQIHKERGEDVDEELKLTKRNLIPA